MPAGEGMRVTVVAAHESGAMRSSMAAANGMQCLRFRGEDDVVREVHGRALWGRGHRPRKGDTGVLEERAMNRVFVADCPAQRNPGHEGRSGVDEPS